MNSEQPPPYPGPGPSAPGYPAQGYPAQGYSAPGYPTQGYQPQGYPTFTEQPNTAFPNFHPGAVDPYAPQPGYQGYAAPPHPQHGWQNAPPMGPVYGEPPKNPVYMVQDGRRGGSGDNACLTACWTALCCCCLMDMLP
ncbi:hypothetical protein SKAU_G00269600 [Synaphobranchus kaupii]|uniref:Cysteine-rich and transmembrane domain-containing protein 1 n=1 Tax=Synaphobranchus kaupii TaxID=118154 RepID=A0A9Q1F0C4_SYNKA|nr:hypothetical protein SKAU_G00269600 [Synaphobranchus kaupii]